MKIKKKVYSFGGGGGSGIFLRFLNSIKAATATTTSTATIIIGRIGICPVGVAEPLEVGGDEAEDVGEFVRVNEST